MAIFEALLEIDNALVDFLIAATPSNDRDLEDMKRLFILRGDLNLALNGLVAQRLRLALANLPDDVARLNDAAAAMRQVERRIESIQQVLSIAATAVEVAAKAALAVVAL
jgi:hypothetical protein